jgi:16S rRNA processing protein RimM
VPEGDLPDLGADQYFRFDIVGINVVDESGLALGNVEEVLDTGADDVYVVRDDESELLIPAIDSVVKEIDISGRRMVVELIPGLERRALKREPGK